MARNVVVIASGLTEQRSLPHLLSYLHDQGTYVTEVRVPPRNKPLGYSVAERIIRSIWYVNPDAAPQKFVLLVDADGKDPDSVLFPLQEKLTERLPDEIRVRVQYAYAQWHLEAWYFADATNLRAYLSRSAGSVDTSKPDEIQNPKLHLKQLLSPRIYTALVSEEIARTLNPRTIAGRSPSFKGFVDAVLNGTARGSGS